MSTTIFKYFVDERNNVRSTDQGTGNPCTMFLIPCATDETLIASRLTGKVLYQFQGYKSLSELENIGVDTTPYYLNKFLKELTNLNEKSDTIGAGKLKNIKVNAQYLLDKLNKE